MKSLRDYTNNIIIYTGTAALVAAGIFSERALAEEHKLIIKDIQSPSRIYTIESIVDDQYLNTELGKTWIFRNVLNDSLMPNIELLVDDVSYGVSDENGEIIKPTGIEESVDRENIPKEFYLKQNYPNPFNPETKIEYGVTRKGHVKLQVYNILGQEVVTLIDKEQLPGNYTIIWDGKTKNNRELSSGVYFYKLTSDKTILTMKMTLIK